MYKCSFHAKNKLKTMHKNLVDKVTNSKCDSHQLKITVASHVLGMNKIEGGGGSWVRVQYV